MKYVLVIGDGMADNPIEELGGKTPLEAADKPFIDSLAAQSLLGSVLTVPRGLIPGSDTAILSIFGCDPCVCYTGRSPLEAAGCGIALQPGEVSYRCNMCTFEDGNASMDEKRILSHNAGSIEGDISDELICWLFNEPVFRAAADAIGMRVYPGSSFRHIAVQAGGDVEGLNVFPPHDHLGEVIGNLRLSGNANADRLWSLMQLANSKLEHHPINEARRAAGRLPANGIWFWAQGTMAEGGFSDFARDFGKTGSVISAVPLVHGIGFLTGLNRITVEGATGETETNCEGKVQAALNALASGQDFACVHLEGPDEASHAGNLTEKLLCIHYLDERIVKPLFKGLQAMGEDFRMLVLSDHKTLLSTRGHDGDPVPFLLYDSRRQLGCGLTYTEKNGEQGPYIEPATRLMPLLFEKEAL